MMNEAMVKVERKDNEAVVWCVYPTMDIAKQIADMDEKESKADGRHEVKCTIYKACGMKLEDLPEDVQAEVKETCGAFRQANVDFKNGGFSVMASSYVAASYPIDMFHCGTYQQEEVYSPDELKAVHKEIFGYEF